MPAENHSVSYPSPSPFRRMSNALDGAGVCIWRVGLDGRILEVNVFFEMVTGWRAADVVNNSMSAAPLYEGLYLMPTSFLTFYRQSTALERSVDFLSTMSPSLLPRLDYTQTQPPPFHKPASASFPLFTSMTISSLPIVPQHELQSFFPIECREVPTATKDMSGSRSLQTQYLLNQLANMPPLHALKLLSRVRPKHGETLESIQTMCLVRAVTGAPDYILCLTTTDGRRIVKPTELPEPKLARLLSTH